MSNLLELSKMKIERINSDTYLALSLLIDGGYLDEPYLILEFLEKPHKWKEELEECIKIFNESDGNQESCVFENQRFSTK
jgi:hypothetical protein